MTAIPAMARPRCISTPTEFPLLAVAGLASLGVALLLSFLRRREQTRAGH